MIHNLIIFFSLPHTHTHVLSSDCFHNVCLYARTTFVCRICKHWVVHVWHRLELSFDVPQAVEIIHHVVHVVASQRNACQFVRAFCRRPPNVFRMLAISFNAWKKAQAAYPVQLKIYKQQVLQTTAFH